MASFRYASQVERDRTKLPEQRELQAARYTRKELARVREVYAEALGAGAEAIEKLTGKLRSAFGHHGKILDHVKALSGEERVRFLATHTDPPTRRALAGAPHYLSGLEAPTHERLQREIWQEVAPTELRNWTRSRRRWTA